MRQAGRYLPEYRATRAEAGSFLDLCYDPEKACEVTMQPIRRYDFDAAILFADILLLPQALGQNLRFVQGEGPRLDPIVKADHLQRFREQNIHETLSPVYETVSRVRAALDPSKTLIGFAGAPWTVATYMLAGGPLKDPAALRHLYYTERDFLTQLLELIADRTIDYLLKQVEAGAGAVQLFDTWAGGLPPEILDMVSLRPLERIAAGVKAAAPGTPVILFPKGVGTATKRFAALELCDAIGIDYAMEWDWAREHLSPLTVVQGGLDPMSVIAGGTEMEQSIRRLVRTFKGTPYIFNLGHGLTPETPPENVARLVDIVRDEGQS